MKAFSGKFKCLVTYDSVHAEALSVSLSQITSESLLCNSVPVQIDSYTYMFCSFKPSNQCERGWWIVPKTETRVCGIKSLLTAQITRYKAVYSLVSQLVRDGMRQHDAVVLVDGAAAVRLAHPCHVRYAQGAGDKQSIIGI